MLSARSALTPSAATEHDNEPLLQHTAASSTARIPEAATEHSEIQRLLAKAACQEAKRPRKSGKGTKSKRPKKSGKVMRTLYEDYVRLYLLMDYSRDESEFYASILLETDEEPEALDEQLLETKDLCERPEPKKPSNNADKEIPEKEDATIPKPKALDEQCRIPLEPMLQSMVQNVSDEEDNTWGNWTAQCKLQQAPSQAPTACLRRAESDSQERSNRITRRIQFFLNSGYKCVSQARRQAESMIVSKNCLTKIELDKIKEECKDECCNPAGSSASATTPAILRRINTPISDAATERSEIRRLLNLADGNSKSSEAATEHSEIRRLLNLADENSKSSEAATEHSEIPEAACLEAKRRRKSGKGSFSQTQKMLFPGTNAKTTTQACEH